MLKYRVGNGYIDQVQDAGSTDYVRDGNVVKDAPVKTVLVSSLAEAQALTGYEPGTIAYTAAFKSIWQLSPSGEWVAF